MSLNNKDKNRKKKKKKKKQKKVDGGPAPSSPLTKQGDKTKSHQQTSPLPIPVLEGYLYNHFTQEILAQLPLTPGATTRIEATTGNKPLIITLVFPPQSTAQHGEGTAPSPQPMLKIEERARASDDAESRFKELCMNRHHLLQRAKEELKLVEASMLQDNTKKLIEGSDRVAEGQVVNIQRLRQHERTITELEEVHVVMDYTEEMVAKSVVVPAGIAVKTVWFEAPVLWCPTLPLYVTKYRQVREKTVEIPKEVPHHGAAYGVPQLYALGGFSGMGSNENTVERYDLQSNRWETVTPMQTKRFGAGAAAYRGKLYVVGGFDGKSRLRTVERWNGQLDRWEAVASMQQHRYGVGVAVYQGHLYAVGGKNERGIRLCSVERYSEATGVWSLVGSLRTARDSMGICVFEGKLYVAGGVDQDNSALSSVECFDSSTQQWQQVTRMSHSRAGLGMSAHSGKLYAVGGYGGLQGHVETGAHGHVLSSVERYDQGQNHWELVAPLGSGMDAARGTGPDRTHSHAHGDTHAHAHAHVHDHFDPHHNQRTGVGVVVCDGYLYAVGGFDGVSQLDTVERFEFSTNRWETVASMSRARAGLAVVAYGFKRKSGTPEGKQKRQR